MNTEHCEGKTGEKQNLVGWFTIINLLSSRINHKLKTTSVWYSYKNRAMDAGAPLWAGCRRPCLRFPPVVRPLTKAHPAKFFCAGVIVVTVVCSAICRLTISCSSLQTFAIRSRSCPKSRVNVDAFAPPNLGARGGGKPPVTLNANAISQTLLRLLLAIAGWQWAMHDVE